jgi:formylmethanofuran dehydrogenase subunit E
MKTLAEYLDLAAVAHGHLCAGQVLGVRLAMLGLRELGIDDPTAERKRVVTYVEIDRCVTDAVALVANCRLGKRALKFRDWGKVAATFVDLQTGRAVRIATLRRNPVRQATGESGSSAGRLTRLQRPPRRLRPMRRRHQLQTRSRSGRPHALPLLLRRKILRNTVLTLLSRAFDFCDRVFFRC